MKICVLKHVDFEGPGYIKNWAKAHKYKISEVNLHRDEGFPVPSEFDMLVIMGGPMNADQHAKYGWLVKEKKYIRDMVRSGKKVLGICLGAQLIASSLGGKVFKNDEKEIGWFPVRLTGSGKKCRLLRGLPEKIMVFHWHGDTFLLPKGAKRLAKSDACVNQAFIYKSSVLALQFHLEATAAGIAAILKRCKSEIKQGPHVQRLKEIRGSREKISRINSYMEHILNRFVTA